VRGHLDRLTVSHTNLGRRQVVELQQVLVPDDHTIVATQKRAVRQGESHPAILGSPCREVPREPLAIVGRQLAANSQRFVTAQFARWREIRAK